MYTLEERKAAVDLFIATNFNEGLVIKTLGYPSPNALRQWYREYHKTGTLHDKRKPKARFTQEQIDAAIEYYLTHGNCIIDTCRSLGYPNRGTLAMWLKERFPEGVPGAKAYCKSQRFSVKLTREEKYRAVERVVVSHEPEYKVAADCGVSKAAISKWKRQFLGKDSIPMSNCQEPIDLPNTKEALETELERLKAEVSQLRMERDALEAASKMLKKAEGIDLKTLKNREKADVIDALRNEYQLSRLLQLFCISKSSYFYCRTASKLPDKYDSVRKKLKESFRENYECFGYRRMYLCLKNSGITVSEKVIRRLMAEESLVVYQKKRKKYNSYAGEISPAVKNLLQRNFHANAPNQKWLTDLTEFALPSGKIYLSPMIDCFDGFVVHWTIGTSPSAELTNTMLDGAIATLSPSEHPIVHSDRGGHYRWPGWIERMEKAGLTRSMSKKGCSPDNSACEGFFGRLKNELFYGYSWFDVSLEQFSEILDSYIHWYNEHRIKISLGGMSPAEYRRKSGYIV